MPSIKCTGCIELRRGVFDTKAIDLKRYRTESGKYILYICSKGYFPYQTTIGGLLRPGRALKEALAACPERPRGSCVICHKTEKLTHLGGIEEETCTAAVCSEHYKAWSTWLDEHPEKRQHIAPKGRPRHAEWVDVFREFIDDKRLRP
jgi:hypothetical protein